MSIDAIIITNLLRNPQYTRKVLPFLRASYFHDYDAKELFKQYVLFFQRYKHSPTLMELKHEIEQNQTYSEEQYRQLIEACDSIDVHDDPPNYDWLVDKTEEFCQEKAVYNAVTSAINIIDGSDETKTKHAIPDLLKDALSVSFDTAIGHDYFEDAESRFEFYNADVERYKFDIDLFNKITNGGVPKKTLNVILAGCVHPDTVVTVRLKRKIQ